MSYFLDQRPMSIHAYNKSATVKYRVARKIIDLTTDKHNIHKDFARNKFPSQSFNIFKSKISKKSITNHPVQGFDVFHIESKKSKRNNNLVVFYLHGGAYINGIFKQHYDFLNQLIDQTHVKVVIPDYPLAPSFDYKSSYPVVEQAYQKLLETTSSDHIIFMGDSAGGGYALGLYLKLKQNQQPLPRSIVLISPWLDVGLENPEIYKYIDREPMLKDLHGLQRAGKLFAAGEPDHPWISPIRADFNDAPPIHIFIGSNDIFYPDSVQFYHKLEQQGVDAHLYPYKDMMHCWLLVQAFKESRHAFKRIQAIIRSSESEN